MTEYASIPEGSYVELKPGREAVYRRAQAGSRAWVRDNKEDPLGYPMVYIEWDQDHWKWDGEDDGWTFTSHWNVLEEAEDNFARRILEQAKVNAACSKCNQDLDLQQEYIENLMEGFDAALAADGFYLIAVKPQKDPENPHVTIYAPELFNASLTPEASEMVQAQIAHLASRAFQDAALERMNQIIKERKK